SSSALRSPWIADRSRKGTRISVVSAATAISVSALVDEVADVDAGAFELERLVDGLDDPDDVETDLRAGTRRLARADRRAEVADLEEERLGRGNVAPDRVARWGGAPGPRRWRPVRR